MLFVWQPRTSTNVGMETNHFSELTISFCSRSSAEPILLPPPRPVLIPSVSSRLYSFSSHPETQSASLPPTRLPHLSLFSFFRLYTAIFPLLHVPLPSSSRLILSLGPLAPLCKGKRSRNQTSEMRGRSH